MLDADSLVSENDISVVSENDFLICEACLARKIFT